MRLKWYDESKYFIRPGEANVASEFVNANIPRDPDYAIGIGQRSAYGWNEWSSLYKYCYVYACKIQVRVVNITDSTLNENGQQGTARGYLAARLGTNMITCQDMYGTSATKFFSMGTANMAGGTKKISMFRRTKHMFNSNTRVEDYYGTHSTDPDSDHRWYYQIYMESNDSNLGSPKSIYMVYKYVTYYCHFFQRWTRANPTYLAALDQDAPDDQKDIYPPDLTSNASGYTTADTGEPDSNIINP